MKGEWYVQVVPRHTVKITQIPLQAWANGLYFVIFGLNHVLQKEKIGNVNNIPNNFFLKITKNNTLKSEAVGFLQKGKIKNVNNVLRKEFFKIKKNLPPI